MNTAELFLFISIHFILPFKEKEKRLISWLASFGFQLALILPSSGFLHFAFNLACFILPSFDFLHLAFICFILPSFGFHLLHFAFIWLLILWYFLVWLTSSLIFDRFHSLFILIPMSTDYQKLPPHTPICSGKFSN